MNSIKSIPLYFYNSEGEKLSGVLELPQNPISFGVYAHCFTCTKNITAAFVISKALAELGYAVLRFDFSGLGESEGDFAKTSLTSNVNDILSAYNFLEQTYQKPGFLIGHSLGGLACLYASKYITALSACITINAPSNMKHFKERIHVIEKNSNPENYVLDILNKKYTMEKHFVNDMKQYFDVDFSFVNTSTLVIHLDNDDIVPYSHSDLILNSVFCNKKRITLTNMNHLLTKRSYCEDVAGYIAAWFKKHILL